MRALLPHQLDDPDLHDVFGAGWQERGGLRVNMISSADGAAAAQGLSEGLQTPGDNRIFAVLRELADVVLVGASTAVAENYRPIADRPAPIALVSRSLDVDPSHRVFSGDTRTIVYTCETSDPAARATLGEVADVVVVGAGEVDPAKVRADLAERGLRRILCEGGPRILSAFAEAGAVDELCLSISPFVIGPGAVRIVNGEPWAVAQRRLDLAALLEEDGALFARYRLA